MNIKEALDLTGTKNKKRLAEFLQIRPSAVYQWDEDSIPDTGLMRIYQRLDLLPKPQKAS